MFRKMIALLTIFAMLVPLSSAVAADENTSQPTIEEILNSYHEKAFAAQTAEESGGASTYARSGSGSSQTLEQETVAELTAAGYEAYNVTGDNYEALEESLQTDFTSLGLDPNSSYVVVISGEAPTEQSNSNGNPNSRMKDFPAYEDFSGGASSFEHTYDGYTYTMRYVTITSASSLDMIKHSTYTLQPQYWLENTVRSIVNTALVGLVDSLVEKVPIGTIASLIGEAATDHNYTELTPGTLTISASTTWTCSLIQIWYETENRWDTSQCSEHILMQAFCSGYLIDTQSGTSIRYAGQEYTSKQYSEDYFNYSYRIEEAIKAYNTGIQGSIDLDYIYNVHYYLGNETGEVIYSSADDPLFTHNRSFSIPVHDYD